MVQQEPEHVNPTGGPLMWLNAVVKSKQYEQLSATDRGVLFSLWTYVGKDLTCWPSVKTVATRAGLSRAQTASKSIARMIELGIIEREPRPGAPSRYKLTPIGNLDPAEGSALNVVPKNRGTTRNVVGGSARNVVGVVRETHYEPSNNPPEEPSTLKRADSQTDLTVHNEPTAETTALAFAPTNGVSSSERAIVAKAIVSEGIDVGAVDQESVEALAMSAKLVGRLWPKGYSTSGRTGRTVDHMIRAVQTELMVRGGTVGENCGKIARAVQAQCEAAQKSIGRGWQGQCPFLPGINKWLDQGGYRAAPDRFVQSIRGDETEMQRIIRESKERSAV